MLRPLNVTGMAIQLQACMRTLLAVGPTPSKAYVQARRQVADLKEQRSRHAVYVFVILRRGCCLLT